MKIYFFLINLLILSGYSYADVVTDTRNQKDGLVNQENSFNNSLDGIGNNQITIESEIKEIEANQNNLIQEIDGLLQQIEELKNSNQSQNMDLIDSLNNQLASKYKEYSQEESKKHELWSETSALSNAINSLIGSYCSYETKEISSFNQIKTIISNHDAAYQDYNISEIVDYTDDMNSLKVAIYSKYKDIIDSGLPSIQLSCSSRLRMEFFNEQPSSSTSDTLEYHVIDSYNRLTDLANRMTEKKGQDLAILMMIID